VLSSVCSGEVTDALEVQIGPPRAGSVAWRGVAQRRSPMWMLVGETWPVRGVRKPVDKGSEECGEHIPSGHQLPVRPSRRAYLRHAACSERVQGPPAPAEVTMYAAAAHLLVPDAREQYPCSSPTRRPGMLAVNTSTSMPRFMIVERVQQQRVLTHGRRAREW
jgi:hypothetical protein